jgi:hypothetical protein
MSPGVQRFGEQFLPPGGVSGEREKGKGRGDRGLFKGVGESLKRQEFKAY